MQSAGDVGYSQIPKGLKVIECRAVNGNETDGNILFAAPTAKVACPTCSRPRTTQSTRSR